MPSFQMLVRRLLLLLAVLLCGVFSVTPVAAQANLSLTAVPAFEGNYTPGTWLPVQLELRNDGPAIDVLVVAGATGSSLRHGQRVELPAGAVKQLTLYVALDQEVRSLVVQVEQQNLVLAETEFELRPRRDERMLGLLVASDPQLNLPRRQDVTTFPFNTFLLDPAFFPDRMAGLSSLNLVLLHDVPFANLSPAQQEALIGWVYAGGHLLLGGGPTAARTIASMPTTLLPATLGATRQIDDAPLVALSTAPGPGALPGLALLPVPGAIATGTVDAPAWVSRQVGRGSVTQLAFDPGAPALVRWAQAPAFWQNLLRPEQRITTPFGTQSTVDILQEQVVTAGLSNLPALTLPPVDLMFLVLALYTILIGPGIALILRQFDRQAWAWVVVPGVALATGALVVGLALAIRPEQRLVSRLALVEMTAPDLARVRGFVGILVPQPQEVRLATSAEALVRPVRPAAGVFGQVNGVVGDLAQLSPELPLPLEAWQIQGVMAEAHIPLEGIQATMLLVDGMLQIEVVNTSDLVLRDAVAVFGERVVRLGTLNPGETASQPWPLDPPEAVARNTAPSFLVLSEELEAGQGPGQAASRNVLAREALLNAAVIQNNVLSKEGPFVFAWLDQNPLGMQVNAPAAVQEVTLLSLRPVFRGSGPILLNEGWLRPDWVASQQTQCFGSRGAGVPATMAPTMVELRLPVELAELRAERLSLVLESERTWPNAGVITEVYDWERERWVEQSFDGPGELQLANPAPFLRNGRFQLRLDGRIVEAGCLYLSARLQGVLP
ncbi:hypothetical protein [Candidatus Chloroploca asiatica]|nr:hypothetical protein [Candidatus Chloroploca asiatica]